MTKDALTELPMWVLYDHPSDFPTMWVARKHEWDAATQTYVGTDRVIIRDTREEISDLMNAMGKVFIIRASTDDPVIAGTWI